MDKRLLLNPFPDSRTAIRATLKMLRHEIGMEMWVVARVTDTQVVVIDAVHSGDVYPVSAGTAFAWADTICARMLQGGPQYAPYIPAVPEYANLPVISELEIGAYLGIPLVDSRGKLLGTLCGVDPGPRQVELFRRAEPLLRVIGRFLATLLEREQVAPSEHELPARSANSLLT